MTDSNHVKVDSKVFVYHLNQADSLFYWTDTGSNAVEIPYTNYKIKETDFRVKTATLTTPTALDLTTGIHIVKIITGLHENFIGEVLTDDFTENKDGTYTYQLQDMSREYQTKFELHLGGQANIYRTLIYLITRGGIPISGNITNEMKKNYKKILSGLRPSDLYEQSLWGNYVTMNTMKYAPKMIIRNKTMMEAIRDLTIGYMRYIDVYFDETTGILQVEPFSVHDWLNNGLILTADDVSERSFKFDTTNAITGALIQSTDSGGLGSKYVSTELIGLNLSAFFGYMNTSASNPNQNNSTTTKATSTTKTSTKKTNLMKNPFNNKAKRIIVSADGGSSSFKNTMVNLLKKDGWSVNDLGVGPGTHSRSYNILDKKYAVNLTIYNGADPATIAEPVTGWLKGKHEKYGVTLVQMFDTSSWTNPKGMKPYRYGNFNGYHCKKAWDDNYSSGKVDIANLGAWYKKYINKVKHVCGPTPQYAFNQFNAGGYFKYVNK